MSRTIGTGLTLTVKSVSIKVGEKLYRLQLGSVKRTKNEYTVAVGPVANETIVINLTCNIHVRVGCGSIFYLK